MAWELDSDRPIYAQIVERLKLEIVSGLYAPGARLPSVRARHTHELFSSCIFRISYL